MSICLEMTETQTYSGPLFIYYIVDIGRYSVKINNSVKPKNDRHIPERAFSKARYGKRGVISRRNRQSPSRSTATTKIYLFFTIINITLTKLNAIF